jgi:Spy/CpxP family protein refolding chaperone
MKRSIATRLAVLAAASLITAGSALAQPMHHHGPGGHGGDVAMTIAALKGQLNLNTSQQQQWDNAVAATKAAHAQMRANFQQVQTTLATELAKAEPDLAAVAAAGDNVRAQNQALHKQVRDNWLAIYATFTPDQKAVVKNAIGQRIARMQQMREKFQAAHPQS